MEYKAPEEPSSPTTQSLDIAGTFNLKKTGDQAKKQRRGSFQYDFISSNAYDPRSVASKALRMAGKDPKKQQRERIKIEWRTSYADEVLKNAKLSRAYSPNREPGRDMEIYKATYTGDRMRIKQVDVQTGEDMDEDQLRKMIREREQQRVVERE